jgi:hypothetical protein
MQNDDNGAKQTQGAAHFSQNAKSFMQKIGPKDSTLREEVSQAQENSTQPQCFLPNQHTKRTKRSDENGGRKGIRSEVGNFPDGHCRSPSALHPIPFGRNRIRTCSDSTPPYRAFEI